MFGHQGFQGKHLTKCLEIWNSYNMKYNKADLGVVACPWDPSMISASADIMFEGSLGYMWSYLKTQHKPKQQ